MICCFFLHHASKDPPVQFSDNIFPFSQGCWINEMFTCQDEGQPEKVSEQIDGSPQSSFTRPGNIFLLYLKKRFCNSEAKMRNAYPGAISPIRDEWAGVQGREVETVAKERCDFASGVLVHSRSIDCKTQASETAPHVAARWSKKE